MLSKSTSECSSVGESSVSTPLPSHARLRNFLEEGAERTKSLWMEGEEHCETLSSGHSVVVACGCSNSMDREGGQGPTPKRRTIDSCWLPREVVISFGEGATGRLSVPHMTGLT